MDKRTYLNMEPPEPGSPHNPFELKIESLVIRFVDDKSNIREEFLEFIHCEDGPSGKTISDVILHQLVQLDIDIKNCRGQGYDGAGNMSGKNNGVIKNIQERCGKALGCHCQGYLLNLCVVSACNINSVVVMMNKLQYVQEFLDFPKCLSLLLEMIDECDLPQIKPKTLKDCCRTRWVQRVDSFIIFLDLFKVICDAWRSEACWRPGAKSDFGALDV